MAKLGILLDLPVELLQLVLKCCSTPSYLQLIRTCSILFTIGTTCREVLRHQLQKLPGLPVTEVGAPLESLSTPLLYRELISRAGAHLYGANFHSDATLYTMEEGVIDTKASHLFPGTSQVQNGCIHPSLALVPKGTASVYLYTVSPPKLYTEKTMLLIDKLEPLSNISGEIEILRVVNSRSCPHIISVLQRYEPPAKPAGSPSMHPFVEDTMMPYLSARIRLIHYFIHTPTGRWMPASFTVFPSELEDEFTPLAVDVVDQAFVVVSWQHKELPQTSKVCLHKYNDADVVVRKYGCSYVEYNTIELVDGEEIARRRHFSDTDMPLSDPIVQVRFNDRYQQVIYWHSSSIIYDQFQRLLNSGGTSGSGSAHRARLLDNICYATLPEYDRTSPPVASRFQVGIPFYGYHTRDSANGVCNWYYASVGLTRLPPNGRVGAYILQSTAQCRSDRCGHILNLDRGRRIERWVAVAKLWGFKPNESNLTGLIASSPKGTRLAIANWKTLYIWPLDPYHVLMRNKDGYYPPSMYYPGDPGACAKVSNLPLSSEEGDYEKTDDGWKDVVELRPIILNLDVVCFGLKFTDGEDELTLLTDKGLMIWRLNSNGSALRLNGVIKAEEDVAGGGLSNPLPCYDENGDDDGSGVDTEENEDEDMDDDDDEEEGGEDQEQEDDDGEEMDLDA
ncbi:F-box domain-containing protein [Nannizzia gypsea CBS 118893]|uniref:F-box domain-containing protein n=1 Tax=Arthroderma gypseum (strain ATCC MYA-4604 / CBS 118893) TaxID=535722 RepID=E4V617_ARTGP|nr:F-box domain-containing protein [Nannizzia gypsea CBS 118893]EFR05542.1 F-box domain-containing protein [Nannizzia gypsea CBS 118893]